MMWFGHVRDNRSCQTLSVNGACPSLVICAVPTSVKTFYLYNFIRRKVANKIKNAKKETNNRKKGEMLKTVDYASMHGSFMYGMYLQCHWCLCCCDIFFLLLARYVPNVAKEEYMRSV